MVLIMKKSRKQQCNQRNGDDAAQGGDESHLSDERWIATVFQAEHGAEVATGIAMTTVLILFTKSLTPHALNRK